MIDELLQIVKLCDRRKEWTKEEWIRTLKNCISKGQYIIEVSEEKIIAFSCWLFLKDLNKISNQYVENTNGTIAYIQCAYVKDNKKGLLRQMIKEGVERHKQATHIFFCSDKRNNKSVLMPIRRAK